MPSFTEDRPSAGGVLLGYLTEQVPDGAEVLVAGPHDAALIDALAARATVTCLLRSQPDAIGLESRGVRVLCGSLAKVTDESYDVVVALDGLERLCSVEGPQLDWVESLRALHRLLRPGGTLLLAVENELGVHKLVDPSSSTASQADSAWRPLGEFDTKPGNPGRLAGRLAAEGLAVDWLGAAWPVPHEPTLIATPNALQDGPADALAAVTAGAAGRAYAEKSVLSDPRRLAAAAVRGGLGPELASAWLVVAHRAPRPAAALSLPPVLIGDGPVVELAPGRDGVWTRRVLHEVPGRDLSALNGPLPRGRLLEELLLAACLRHDLPIVRRLLTGWTSAHPGAAADNVVVHEDNYTVPSFSVLDPSVPPQTDVIRRFAQTLIGGGYAHPWPAAVDVPTLTSILHAAAGLPGDDVEAGEEPPLPDSRREHEEQIRALRRQLADATTRAQWFERELGRRDSELRKARMQIAAFSGSVSFRVAKLGVGVARKARNRLRKGLS
ncbi:Methyltransferase domain-containing protein [Paractinoplanes atraurantiacus]|uniref:Methyltransferase domain-containing protein n=2 Tax=Paractinoplanes atraurantiacus TaxID=1036182 RepID=A0A285KL77_9ACTN|nr:Methyltransferase domain-containing protein [Actinoplanes atraurantiacus]